MADAASSTFSPAQRAMGFVALTKPRIIELLLITTVPAMIVARRGLPSLWLILATLVGGTLAAGGANAANMYVDQDIDRVMDRTSKRPLVTGVIRPAEALTFAVLLEVLAFGELWSTVNLLSAILALSATLFYVFVYTLWLKRTSSQNIVIGGAAGAVPTLVGWAAVTDHLSVAPWFLFALIFVWTPPHFWALAVRYRDDYARAEVPMLPAVASMKATTSQILVYSFITVGVSIGFGVAAGLGWAYQALAAVLGAAFLYQAFRLHRSPSSAAGMRLFGYSITYLVLLFSGMAVLVLTHLG